MSLAFGGPLELLVVASVKATLVVALAAVIVAFLRRGPAALRHLVWATGLSGALLIPMLSIALPGWSVPGVPSLSLSPAEGVESSVAPAAPSPAPPSPDAPPPASTTPREDGLTARAGADPVVRSLVLSSSANIASPPARVPPRRARPLPPPPPRLPSLPAAIVALWLAGVGIALGGIVWARLSLARLARRARPVSDSNLISAARDAGHLLGLSRPFALLQGPAGNVPVTWGIWRPVVLLPEGAAEWPIEWQRAVLIHELAHVARRDCLTQVLGQLARALFWFHPAIAYAERQLRSERERACDDYVLGAAVKATDYADQILDVVRNLRSGRWSTIGAVAFARRSNLEGRILAILDPERDRRLPSRAGVLRMAAVFAVVVVALAVARPATRGASAETRSHGSLILERAPRAAKALMGPPARVVNAPEGLKSLETRWRWAIENAVARGEDLWIGYRVKGDADSKARVITDSGDLYVEFLDDDHSRASLQKALESVGTIPSNAGPDHGLAVLLHVSRAEDGGVQVDRLRAQSFALPAELADRTLFWLGDAESEASVGLLQGLEGELASAHLRSTLVDAIGLHAASDAAVDFLAAKAGSDDAEELRGEAVEALSGRVSQKVVESLESIIDSGDGVEAVEAEEGAPASPPEEPTPAEASVGEPAPTPCPATPPTAPVYSSRSMFPTPAPRPTPGSHSLLAPTPAPEADAAGPDDDTELQRQAVESLGRMPEAISLPRLIRIASDHPSLRVRVQAVESLGRLGTDGSLGVIERLIWQGHEVELQMQAVESLGRFPAKVAVHRLIPIAYSHPVDAVRRQAIECLGRYPGQESVDALDTIIQSDRDLEVRAHALEALSRLPDDVSIARLAALAQSDLPTPLRRLAIECLGRHDPDAAMPALENLVKVGRKELKELKELEYLEGAKKK